LTYNLRYSLGLGMAVSIIAGSLAFAHHSTAGYDLDHMEELPGTLKQLNWANPHISFIIDTDAIHSAGRSRDVHVRTAARREAGGNSEEGQAR
jgi:hypothetical protein